MSLDYLQKYKTQQNQNRRENILHLAQALPFLALHLIDQVLLSLPLLLTF